ncbi:MAG: hypothetical protein WDN31_08265 [Hyphomicrobium sp.]
MREQPPHDHAVHQRETWRAPGNVVIEEGFSHLAWPPQSAARSSAPEQPPRASESFVPAPPADLRRGGRRMPEVNDFPVVAQREYRAKTGYATPPPAPPAAPALEEPQRRGILQRIMGRNRRDDLDDVQTGNAAPDPRRVSGASPDDWWAGSDSQQEDDQEQPRPLPDFFNRQRK